MEGIENNEQKLKIEVSEGQTQINTGVTIQLPKLQTMYIIESEKQRQSNLKSLLL